ncbi:hypothetical protein BGX26_003079 [Mortierella sp. AD094]|nr:hypothetical protein BGX26_003079 [Mortierella sp. AD094]
MKYLRYLLAAVACTTFITNPVLSKCCYTLSSQPLGPDSPSSYAVSLTASSQSAFDSEGMVYKAIIKFSSSFIIAATPSICTVQSSTSVACQSSGQSSLLVSFSNITQVYDPTLMSFGGSYEQEGAVAYDFSDVMAGPSSANSVSVNGETCTVNTTCPMLTSTHPSPTSTTSPTSIIPPTTQASSNNSTSSSSSNKGMIIGVSCGVGVLVLLACCVVLRRNMTSASSTGLKRGESQYSLGHPSDSGSTAAYGGPNSYALYREKTLKRQQSVREFHEAVAAMAVTQEAAIQHDLEGTRSKEVLPPSYFSDARGGFEDTAEAMELGRHPSRKSTRSSTSEKVLARGMAPVAEIPEISSASLNERGVALDNQYPAGNGKSSSLAAVRVDGNESNGDDSKRATRKEEQQNHPLGRSRSTRYPWAPPGQTPPLSVSTSSPALVSAPIPRQTNLSRNTSVRTTKSGNSGHSRAYYNTGSTDDLYQQKQLPQRPRPSMKSEPISLTSLTPQSPPAIPMRSPSRREQDLARVDLEVHHAHVSHQSKLPDDKTGAHGLYGYL